MGILSRLTDPPKARPPLYRYKVLVVGLCLLAFIIFMNTREPGDIPDLYEDVLLVLAFLFCFVAYEFAWPTPVNVILRILALILIFFAIFYIFYFSRVLYPISP